ncbi:MAG TPA: nucleotide sugar dehydrogenase [Mycobacteriales bacterium]|nr:nucleotide sugar dehydrogenase [Mycobacteriales bacterium]
MAHLGHNVLGLDTDPATVAALRAGHAPFAEPGLAEAIADGAVSGALTFTGDYLCAAAHADLFILAVPTPQMPDSERHDLSAVFMAVDALADALSTDALLVVKSSVPAGTCEKIAQCLAARRPDLTVEVAASPDFMREGMSIPDVRRPSRIVLGIQKHGRAEQVMRRVWATCLNAGVPLTVTTLRTAELCKLAANAYLATRLSFVNALADFSATVGADITALTEVTGHDPRIGSSYFTPGLGFGGSCLSKDLRGLTALATERGVCETTALLASVDRINQQRRRRAIDLAVGHLPGGPAGHRIGIWGAAFKPGVDDVRDSPALDVAAQLSTAGATVSVYDPAAMNTARREHPELRYSGSAAEAAAGAQVLMHLTAWPQFAQVDPRDLSPARTPLLVDARPGLDRLRWQQAGWAVSPL